jgi:AbrB family looped-hinge helix DNA binding protein
MGMHKSATRLSTKGQVILPKAVRDAKRWAPGARLVVEATQDGVLLRQEEALFAPTSFEDVRGSLAHFGKSLTSEEIERNLRAAAKRRHAGD